MTSPVPVRLSADYLASPLWVPIERGWASVPLARFDLTPGLRHRLEGWASAFDALMDTDYAWPSPEAEQSWEQEAGVLVDLVRRELGDAYSVELVL